MRFWATTLAIGLAGCGSADPETAPVSAPEVRVAQVGGAIVSDRVETAGTVALRRETSLGFTSAGRIASLRVNEGDVVRQGQVLAALDMTTTGADLSAARAERERAASEYARSARLLEQGWVTRPRVESAKAALQAADARVRATGFQSNNAVIVAPGSGTILARLAEPGQIVSAGTPVLVLGESASGYVLRLPLADRDAAGIRIGASAIVKLAALGNTEVSGSVIEIAGRSDRATGTFTVEIALPADPRLRSGQIGTASIIASGRGSTALAVPPAAVFAPRAGQAFVYVVDPANKKLSLRRVTIGDATDSAIRVTGGIKRGEWVAVSRIDRLADKMTILPIRRTP